MIEKKTTEDIDLEISQKQKSFACSEKDFKEFYKKKVWISEDSLIEELNYDLKIIMSNTDKKKKEFISTYIKLLIKQLESVKEDDNR